MVRELFGAQPDAWQERALRSYPTCPRLAMKACTGPGKAIRKQELIETPFGLRRFGDLRPGDFVFAEDGSSTRVVGVYPQGVMPLFRVTFDDGSSSICSGDHLWKVRGRTERRHFKMRQSPDWTPERGGWRRLTHSEHGLASKTPRFDVPDPTLSIDARELARDIQCSIECRARAQGGYLTPPDGYSILTTDRIIARGVKDATHNGRNQFEIPRQGGAQFPHMIQPLDPYLVGVWIGDGCKGEPKYSKPYQEVQDEIAKRGYETSRHSDGKGVFIRQSRADFEKLDCFYLGSHERFIPGNYKYASIIQRRDLICGLMDTDGCIGDDGHMEYSTTSERLANDVVWLARSLGGVALIKAAIKEGRYRAPDGQMVECRDCYRVSVCLPFNPFRIAHKAERWKDPLRSPTSARYLTRFITSIEPAGEDECMCIAVEHPSHCYLTNDFIVTHNTTVLAWIGWNFILTRPHSMIGCASITGANLKTGLWTELSRWHIQSPLLQRLFEKTGDKIYMRGHAETWRIEARCWARSADKEAIGNALAGLHAPYVMWLLDETGDYPDAVMPTCEAIFSGEPIEAHIIQAGNPTRRGGPLFRAWMRRNDANRLWEVISITADPDDPSRTPRVSIKHALEQIQEYGRENPWIRVKIFGEFPDQDFNALISEDEVRAAMNRYYRGPTGAKVLGIDVADYGDDQSVIFPRQGLQALVPKKMRHVNSTDGSAIAVRHWNEFPSIGGEADAAFIDAGGGYGAGWRDGMLQLGRAPISIYFGGSPHEKKRFFNKRMEMYWDACEWIRRGGALTDSEELVKTLSQTKYGMRNDQMFLEPKEDIKKELGFSPDEGDAFCLVAGTRIATTGGWLPIERAGNERILTPLGEALSIKVWAHETMQLTTVEFSDGSKLVGTPDHEIFVFGYGKVRLDALLLTMAISPLVERRKWLMTSGLFTRARSIGFKRAVAIIPLASQFSVSGFCIGAYEPSIMAQSRMVTRSIIATMIGGAARLATWNCSKRQSTMPCIQTGGEPLATGSTITMANARESWLRLGILLRKASLGIVRMARKLGLIVEFLQIHARNAEMNSRHTSSEQDFAQKRVCKVLLLDVISQKLGHALIAGRRSLLTAIGRPLVVPVSVRTENVPPTMVYNLTLNRDNAFYANGVLVFNCLTFAEPVTPRQSAPPLVLPRHQEFNPFAEEGGGRDFNPYRG
jgi:hypothetical protein